MIGGPGPRARPGAARRGLRAHPRRRQRVPRPDQPRDRTRSPAAARTRASAPTSTPRWRSRRSTSSTATSSTRSACAANLHLHHGDWPAAEADARASLALGEQRGVSLCPALVSLGRLQARRGDPEAGATLEEAWRVATATGELQRIAPTVAGVAEHAWLDGRLEERAGAARVHLRARRARATSRWARAELALWLRRAGRDVPPHPDDPEPCALAAAGDWRAAAAAWGAYRVRLRRGERARGGG